MAEKLQIVIDAKDQASPVLKGVAGTAKTSFAGMAGPIKAHAGEIRAAGMATTAFGVATLAVAKGNIDAYRKQEVAGAKLTAAIKGTAQSIDQSRLEDLAKELQKVTTFGDEATIEMMALLTTFNLTQDQIEQLAPRIQNISAIMGTDMQSAAIAVGKAISPRSKPPSPSSSRQWRSPRPSSQPPSAKPSSSPPREPDCWPFRSEQ